MIIKKNLVIGATGIVGSHVLLNLLLDNQVVIACKQKTSNLEPVEKLFSFYTTDARTLFEKITWIEIDLNDVFSIEEALVGVNNVYHCAGFVSFVRFEKKKLMSVNVTGTRNIVNACLKQQIDALCYVSSLAAIHNLDVDTDIHESVFWKSSGKESDYALSKYKAELEVWRGIEEGLNAVIVNPGVILSPTFWNQSSAKIFNTCYKGNLFYPLGKTAYVGANDVAICMLSLIKIQAFGQRFILIEGNYSFKSIFSHIQKCFNNKPPIIPASRFILKLGWLADSVLAFIIDRQAIITRALINSAQNKQNYSNQKVVQLLNYSFKPSFELIDEICKEYVKDKRTKSS